MSDNRNMAAARAALRRIRFGRGGDVELEVEDKPSKVDPDAEVYGEATDDDPELPGTERKHGPDPNAEIYGEADDDDVELPGTLRRSMRRNR